MDMGPLTPERKAQLDDYAQRHGQDTAAALDDVLANYLEWERQDYTETVDAVPHRITPAPLRASLTPISTLRIIRNGIHKRDTEQGA
jgi:hypothetical protein